MSGAAITEWIPAARTKASRSALWVNRSSSRYSPGPGRRVAADGQPRDADVRVDGDVLEQVGRVRGPGAGLVVRPRLGHALAVDQVDRHAARLEQPGRRVDDRLEDLALVAHRADARRDLAQRPLRVGGLGEGGLGPRELVDEARVRDRDGGLAGERPDQADVGRR